jgi:hypothetical protein
MRSPLSTAKRVSCLAKVFSSNRAKWIIAGTAFAVPLLFALFTQHAWEDYFITLRSSRNLVEGHGLVFNPGDRLHTFTSPLGVLLPALCTAIVGVQHEQAALWLFRIINASALGFAALRLWRHCAVLGLQTPGRWTAFGLILFDAKLNDFAMNGMETALLVLFSLRLWEELESTGRPRAVSIAVASAGLMWTRPDAFVLAGALIIPHLLFRRRTGDSAPSRWRTIASGLVGGAGLYLPWIAWAWWYYGSPVPHTIVAKSAFTPSIHLTDLLLLPIRHLSGATTFDDLFLPAYSFFGGWPRYFNAVAHALAVLGAFAWCVPKLSPVARRLSLTVFLGTLYLGSIILFPWYVPPWTVLASLAIGFTVDQLYRTLQAARWTFLLPVLRLTLLLVLAVQASAFGGAAWQMRWHQKFVETGVRRAIGEWLHENSSRNDTLFLEPLGYIGYFSQLKTYDFPGLSSREVVAAVRNGARNYADVIERLQPTWVVLRPSEAARSEFTAKPVLQDYELVKSWSAMPQLDGIEYLPGRAWSEFEASYNLYRRKKP